MIRRSSFPSRVLVVDESDESRDAMLRALECLGPVAEDRVHPRSAGQEIPIEARICGIVDVFDALTVDRCYGEALPNDVVYEMLKNERGKHFDPMILDVFLEHRSEIEGIQRAEIKDEGSSTGIRLL